MNQIENETATALTQAAPAPSPVAWPTRARVRELFAARYINRTIALWVMWATMNTLLKLEELGIFLFSIFLFSTLAYPWWLFPVLLFAPDLSMIGYAANPAVGAFTYNLIHHRAIALMLYVAGVWLSLPTISLIGIIMLAHASLDRVIGYGLKYSDAFEHTHLGTIGRPPQNDKAS